MNSWLRRLSTDTSSRFFVLNPLPRCLTEGMGVLSVGLIKYLTGEYDVELVRRLSVENQGET